MQKELLLEINRMRSIMELPTIQHKGEEIPILEAMNRLQILSEGILLSESLGGLGSVLDDIIEVLIKSGDDAIEGLFKNVDDIKIRLFKNSSGVNKLIDDLGLVLKGSNLDGEVGKKSLLTLLNNGRISDAVGDSWKGWVDSLDSEVLRKIIKVDGNDMELGEYLYKAQDDIEAGYRDLEKYLRDAVNDPKNTRFKSGDEFITDLKSSLDEDLSFLKNSDGENILYKNLEEVFDENLGVYKIPNRGVEIEKLADDIVDEIKVSGWNKAGKAFVNIMKWLKKIIGEAFQIVFKRSITRNRKAMTVIDAKGLPPITKKISKIFATAGNVIFSALQNTVEILTLWVRPLLKKLFTAVRKSGSKYETQTFRDISKMFSVVVFEVSSFISQLAIMIYFPKKLAKVMTITQAFTGNAGYLGKLAEGVKGASQILDDYLIDPVLRGLSGEELEKNEKMANEVTQNVLDGIENFSENGKKLKGLPDKLEQAQKCFKEKFGDFNMEEDDVTISDDFEVEGSEKLKEIVAAIRGGDKEKAKELMKKYTEGITSVWKTGGQLSDDIDAFLKLCESMETIEGEIMDGVTQM